MRSIVLIAVSQFIGLAGFCQAPASPSGAGWSPFASSALPESVLTSDGGQGWQAVPFKAPRCEASKANPEQRKGEPNPNPLFHPPCLDPQIFALNAQNRMEAPPLPGGKWNHAKAIPIPTQWPNAKFEPIPTQWPDLKVVPLSAERAMPKAPK